MNHRTLQRMIQLKDILTVSPADLQALANDADIAKNLRDVFPYPYSEEDARQFLSLNERGIIRHSFAIYNDDTFIGLVGVIPQTDIHRMNGEVGYWLGRKYWGNGFGTETVKLITDYAFNTLNLYRCFAGIFETNKASMRVLEKAGYTMEAVIKSSIIKNDKLMKEHLYSRLRSS